MPIDSVKIRCYGLWHPRCAAIPKGSASRWEIMNNGDRNTIMNTTEAVARILKMEGIEWVSCYPSNLLIEAVAKEGIRPVMFDSLVKSLCRPN